MPPGPRRARAPFPWIDGRAYWPKRSYDPDDLKGEEGRALMDRLLVDAGDVEAIES
ncbi:hypothetical protein AB0O05_11350 [Streptomyces sp. NPDC093084]|uniref:hypothetical protein n=1 Tax=Streptomyces sp. NPDC093084 TaxID=3155197 RepID=UPI003415845F